MSVNSKIILLVTGTSGTIAGALSRTKQLYAEYHEEGMLPIAPALALLATFEELVKEVDLTNLYSQYELIISSNRLSMVRFIGNDGFHVRLRQLAEEHQVKVFV